jgi:predicted homoserine dehydrogenase-like protein
MNLYALLSQREADGKPLRVGLIGAGKFGTMYLAQVQRTPGVRLTAIADLAPARARAALERVGWARELPRIGDDSAALVAASDVDIVIESTGDPAAGVRHALACAREGKHVVMVNVEADALAGPLLAARARAAGVVYSLASGDQPALVCEMVDWARAAGFEVVAAGKGTRYLPRYHRSTPETVWGDYGITPEDAAKGGLNAQMFNSFLDGTKSAIEMAALSNATGLAAPSDGLAFPPCGADDLAEVLRPLEDGGLLEASGQVEVVSSLHRDGSAVSRDLRWGVYVVFRAGSPYVERCFAEYGLRTDSSGRYTALYRPYHLIGLELGISVASVGVRREPTGAPLRWSADAVAVAKRPLAAGELLDGEGGFCVFGKLMRAVDSAAAGAVPIGLARGVRLTRPVAQDRPVTWADITVDASDEAVRVRREMEREFAPAGR